jgi:large subunit ribosomal protein L18
MKRLVHATKNKLRQVRHARVRKSVIGTADCPRLSVFRSLRGMIAQLIDDNAGRTLCYVASTEIGAKEKAEGKKAKVAVGYLMGMKLAEKAKAKGIAKAVFDRAGYAYHGRVQALAEGAREGGLQF